MATSSKPRLENGTSFITLCERYFKKYEDEQQRWFVQRYIDKYLALDKLDHLWKFLMETCSMRYSPDVKDLKKAVDLANQEGIDLRKGQAHHKKAEEEIPEDELASPDEVDELLGGLGAAAHSLIQTSENPGESGDRAWSEDDIPF
jgi:hypothetical protein